MIYLDSCALVKLIRTEDGSSALQEWLDERSDELTVTSALSRAEVLRTIRRNNHRETGELIDGAALAEELARRPRCSLRWHRSPWTPTSLTAPVRSSSR